MRPEPVFDLLCSVAARQRWLTVILAASVAVAGFAVAAPWMPGAVAALVAGGAAVTLVYARRGT